MRESRQMNTIISNEEIEESSFKAFETNNHILRWSYMKPVATDTGLARIITTNDEIVIIAK